jgi:hypothetical protein
MTFLYNGCDTFIYIDDSEILIFPSEIKNRNSLSEIKTFSSPYCHSTNIVTIENIIECPIMKNKFFFQMSYLRKQKRLID